MNIRVLLGTVIAVALVTACAGESDDSAPTARKTVTPNTPSQTAAAEATAGQSLLGLESRAGLDHLLICVDVSPAAIPAMRATEAAALVTGARSPATRASMAWPVTRFATPGPRRSLR